MARISDRAETVKPFRARSRVRSRMSDGRDEIVARRTRSTKLWSAEPPICVVGNAVKPAIEDAAGRDIRTRYVGTTGMSY